MEKRMEKSWDQRFQERIKFIEHLPINLETDMTGDYIIPSSTRIPKEILNYTYKIDPMIKKLYIELSFPKGRADLDEEIRQRINKRKKYLFMKICGDNIILQLILEKYPELRQKTHNPPDIKFHQYFQPDASPLYSLENFYGTNSN